MEKILHIHPDNPQKRLLMRAVDTLNQGGVIIYPTDTSYAFGTAVSNKKSSNRIKEIQPSEQKRLFHLVCSNFSDAAQYAHIDNSTYRIMKQYLPGPYTFILPAMNRTPKWLLLPTKKNSLSLRIPKHEVTQQLLSFLHIPISSTPILPKEEDHEMMEEAQIYTLQKRVDLILYYGPCTPQEHSTIAIQEGNPVFL